MPIEKADNPLQKSVYRFDRVELAGAFGDMGTLLPIVVAMILINQLSPSTVFLAFGLFYLLAGIYYRLPIPIQPLKAVGAVAIAYPAVITESVIGAAGICPPLTTVLRKKIAVIGRAGRSCLRLRTSLSAALRA